MITVLLTMLTTLKMLTHFPGVSASVTKPQLENNWEVRNRKVMGKRENWKSYPLPKREESSLS
jgi:hypothetical protein